MLLSCRCQSSTLQSKSVDWFLYEENIGLIQWYLNYLNIYNYTMNARAEQNFPSLTGCARQREVEILKQLLVSTLHKSG